MFSVTIVLRKMNVLDLNEDCLIHLCRYFDAEAIVTVTQTCSRLKYVAESYLQFKKSYSCNIGSEESKVVAGRTIRKMGKYLTKIDLMVDLQYQGSLTEFFRLLVRSVGPNLIELSILGEVCVMSLQILAPILSHLEVLTLQNLCWKERCVSTIDLPQLCPNLRKLIVCGPIIFAPKYNKEFQRLESLDVTFSSGQIPADVFTQNRQLVRLFFIRISDNHEDTF